MSYGLENIDFRSITYLQQFSEKHRKHGDFSHRKRKGACAADGQGQRN
jgi:hypothetical protein